MNKICIWYFFPFSSPIQTIPFIFKKKKKKEFDMEKMEKKRKIKVAECLFVCIDMLIFVPIMYQNS